MKKYDRELQLAVRASHDAASLIKEKSRQEIVADTGRDVKHGADFASEKIIMERLGRYSEIPVLSEEAGAVGEFGTQDRFWVIDPLDGTLNYSRNIPLFCVSIALFESGMPVLGVVNDFNHGECFTGISGIGAWLNGKRIEPSSTTILEKAVLATGFPVNRDFGSDSLSLFTNHVRRFKKLRLFGSAAISLAYTACGRVDAYFEEDIMIWDVAAGIALVEAAGGFVLRSDSAIKKWACTIRAGEVFRTIFD